MKTIIILIATLIFLTSCDPDNKDIFNLETVKIGAVLNNNNSIIILGDTIKIKAQLPDVLNGNSGNVSIQSLQKAQFFLKIRKIDTSANTSILLQQPVYWTVKGSISPTNNFDFNFNSDNKPFEVIIYFKPIEKGIYVLEVVSQSGQIKLNNAYEARLIVNFNVPNKHIELAAPYFTTAWANDAQTREYGTYVFRVN